jgi:hypothetical protein
MTGESLHLCIVPWSRAGHIVDLADPLIANPRASSRRHLRDRTPTQKYYEKQRFHLAVSKGKGLEATMDELETATMKREHINECIALKSSFVNPHFCYTA